MTTINVYIPKEIAIINNLKIGVCSVDIDFSEWTEEERLCLARITSEINPNITYEYILPFGKYTNPLDAKQIRAVIAKQAVEESERKASLAAIRAEEQERHLARLREKPIYCINSNEAIQVGRSEEYEAYVAETNAKNEIMRAAEKEKSEAREAAIQKEKDDIAARFEPIEYERYKGGHMPWREYVDMAANVLIKDFHELGVERLTVTGYEDSELSSRQYKEYQEWSNLAKSKGVEFKLIKYGEPKHRGAMITVEVAGITFDFVHRWN